MLYNVSVVKTIDIFLGQLSWKLGAPEWMNEPSTNGLNHAGCEGVG
jgi:hypothetical protein